MAGMRPQDDPRLQREKREARKAVGAMTRHMKSMYCPHVLSDCIGSKCVHFQRGDVSLRINPYWSPGLGTELMAKYDLAFDYEAKAPRCKLWGTEK